MQLMLILTSNYHRIIEQADFEGAKATSVCYIWYYSIQTKSITSLSNGLNLDTFP